jgi:hypothetical protein
MEKYNGWTNYATWRVNLEVLDGMQLEDFGYCLHELDVDGPEGAELLSEAMNDYATQALTTDGELSNFALSLVESFLDKVNWVEIADH